MKYPIRKSSIVFQLTIRLVLIAFIGTILGPLPANAQELFFLPKPGVMVHLSPPFNPAIIKGIKVYPENPLRFDFILDKGDREQGSEQLKEESKRLIKYFLAAMTVPEADLWVNLSPYEKQRVIPASFGQTEMGRDILAQDYMLKQITASLIYPEDELGKKFWKRVYEEAAKKFGTTNIPINTFNKVWIVPQKAVVYENAKAGTAYVVESKLKVMLEQDYLSSSKQVISQVNASEANQIGSQIVKEIIIPQLTREVNENQNFVQLRQVYHSLILAAWYKKKIKDSILTKVYADKNKVSGVEYTNKLTEDQQTDIEGIYQQYLKAFKKGVFNYIKDDMDIQSHDNIPRKYFSGGVNFDMAMSALSGQTNLGRGVIEYTSSIGANDLNSDNRLIATADMTPKADEAMTASSASHPLTEVEINERIPKILTAIFWKKDVIDEKDMRSSVKKALEVGGSYWADRLQSTGLYGIYSTFDAVQILDVITKSMESLKASGIDSNYLVDFINSLGAYGTSHIRGASKLQEILDGYNRALIKAGNNSKLLSKFLLETGIYQSDSKTGRPKVDTEYIAEFAQEMAGYIADADESSVKELGEMLNEISFEDFNKNKKNFVQGLLKALDKAGHNKAELSSIYDQINHKDRIITADNAIHLAEALAQVIGKFKFVEEYPNRERSDLDEKVGIRAFKRIIDAAKTQSEAEHPMIVLSSENVIEFVNQINEEIGDINNANDEYALEVMAAFRGAYRGYTSFEPLVKLEDLKGQMSQIKQEINARNLGINGKYLGALLWELQDKNVYTKDNVLSWVSAFVNAVSLAGENNDELKQLVDLFDNHLKDPVIASKWLTALANGVREADKKAGVLVKIMTKLQDQIVDADIVVQWVPIIVKVIAQAGEGSGELETSVEYLKEKLVDPKTFEDLLLPIAKALSKKIDKASTKVNDVLIRLKSVIAPDNIDFFVQAIVSSIEKADVQGGLIPDFVGAMLGLEKDQTKKTSLALAVMKRAAGDKGFLVLFNETKYTKVWQEEKSKKIIRTLMSFLEGDKPRGYGAISQFIFLYISALAIISGSELDGTYTDSFYQKVEDIVRTYAQSADMTNQDFMKRMELIYKDVVKGAINKIFEGENRIDEGELNQFIQHFTEDQDSILFTEVNNFIALYWRIKNDNKDTTDKMREVLKYLIKTRDAGQLNKWLITQAPWNKPMYESIKSLYEDILTNGFTKTVYVAGGKIDKEDRMRDQTWQIYEIAQDNHLPNLPQRTQGLGFNTYLEAKAFAEKYIFIEGVKEEIKEYVRQVLEDAKLQEENLKSGVAESGVVTIEIEKKVLADSSSGKYVVGCFNPNGGHKEMPAQHALNAGELFLRVRAENSEEVANAVVFLSPQGLAVQKLYESPGLKMDVSGAIFDALAELVLQGKAPAILGLSSSAGLGFGRKYFKLSPTKVTMPIVLEDDYYSDISHKKEDGYRNFDFKFLLNKDALNGYVPLSIYNVKQQQKVQAGPEAKVEDQQSTPKRDEEKAAIKKQATGAIFALGYKDVNMGPLLGKLDRFLFAEDVDDREVVDFIGTLRNKDKSVPDPVAVSQVIAQKVLELRRSIQNKDTAMLANKGGIDLTNDQLPLEIQNETSIKTFNIDPLMMAKVQNAVGFEPVIIDLKPAGDLAAFLGVSQLN